MSIPIDEFDIPTELNLQGATTRIMQWLKAGEPGTDYLLTGVSDKQITISKDKRDLKICGISCCGTCGIVLLFFPIIVGLAMYGGPDAVMVAANAMLLLIGIGLVGGVACFFLRSDTVTYDLRFSEGPPLRVMVYGEGDVESFRLDYDSLKSVIFSETLPPARGHW